MDKAKLMHGKELRPEGNARPKEGVPRIEVKADECGDTRGCLQSS